MKFLKYPILLSFFWILPTLLLFQLCKFYRQKWNNSSLMKSALSFFKGYIKILKEDTIFYRLAWGSSHPLPAWCFRVTEHFGMPEECGIRVIASNCKHNDVAISTKRIREHISRHLQLVHVFTNAPKRHNTRSRDQQMPSNKQQKNHWLVSS